MSVSIIIVEDDAGLLRPLVAVLTAPGTSVRVLGVAATGAEGIAIARKLQPDVALVDLNLPDLPGIEVIRQLCRVEPPIASIAWTIMGDPEHVHPAVSAGAAGYLLKDESPERVCAAIHEAALGGAPLSPAAARLILERARLAGEADADAEAPAALTPREGEVLALLSRGHTYADCARALSMGLGTVQCHVKSIYRKLNVASKAEAAAWAIRNRVVA